MLTTNRAAPALAVAIVATLLVAVTSAHAADQPKASVTPAKLTFTTTTGTTSDPQGVTVTNTGTAPLTVASVAVVGPDRSRFSHSGTCFPLAPVPPGGSCFVAVSFSPVEDGPHSATLRITDNDPGDSTQDVELEGTATPAPAASVTPRSLAFTAAVGTTSPGRQATLTNSGNGTLSDIRVELIGANFAIAASSCEASLASGQSCAVTTTFSPRAAGGQTATLRFSSNDPANPALDVALTGTGTGTSASTTTRPGSTTAPPALSPLTSAADGDKDGVPNAIDLCPTFPGNLENGCPTRLRADVRGHWRVNDTLSQLLTLEVRAPTGSRIELRCSGKQGVCGFRKRTIAKTTRYATGLTRNFKGKRFLPAGMLISVRVTKPLHRGTYESLLTRRGRKLPLVKNRCVNQRGEVQRCP